MKRINYFRAFNQQEERNGTQKKRDALEQVKNIKY